MVRPMLLSYIETLVDTSGEDEISKTNKKKILTTADIYGILIKQWILRESKRIEIAEREAFKINMYKFSEDLALYLFTNKRNILTLETGEIMSLAMTNQINLSELELKGKSLLNRDAIGNYKFSHKSILEYFLAKHAILDPRFGEGTLHFKEMEGFDQAATFCEELMREQL
jgi:CRISPR/Cas system CMR-associated protein Cmr3 (group 5 of RAMP superfamily)